MLAAFREQVEKVVFQGGQVWEPCTTRQIQKLIILMQEELVSGEREIRLAVTSELLGYPISSYNELKKWEVLLLIDTLTEKDRPWEIRQDGRYFLREAQFAISAEPEERDPGHPPSGQRPGPVPDLQEAPGLDWFRDARSPADPGAM